MCQPKSTASFKNTPVIDQPTRSISGTILLWVFFVLLALGGTYLILNSQPAHSQEQTQSQSLDTELNTLKDVATLTTYPVTPTFKAVFEDHLGTPPVEYDTVIIALPKDEAANFGLIALGMDNKLVDYKMAALPKILRIKTLLDEAVKGSKS